MGYWELGVRLERGIVFSVTLVEWGYISLLGACTNQFWMDLDWGEEEEDNIPGGLINRRAGLWAQSKLIRVKECCCNLTSKMLGCHDGLVDSRGTTNC
jgi:hypothetical protein